MKPGERLTPVLWSGSAIHGIAKPLFHLFLRNSGRKTAAHFSWNCSSTRHSDLSARWRAAFQNKGDAIPFQLRIEVTAASLSDTSSSARRNVSINRCIARLRADWDMPSLMAARVKLKIACTGSQQGHRAESVHTFGSAEAGFRQAALSTESRLYLFGAGSRLGLFSCAYA